MHVPKLIRFSLASTSGVWLWGVLTGLPLEKQTIHRLSASCGRHANLVFYLQHGAARVEFGDAFDASGGMNFNSGPFGGIDGGMYVQLSSKVARATRIVSLALPISLDQLGYLQYNPEMKWWFQGKPSQRGKLG